MNGNLNIKQIIRKNKLDIVEISKQLFPNNKYSKRALDRVISGKAFLDTNQLSKLSLITGVSIQDLYSESNWKITSDSDVVKFTLGEFTAVLDLEKNTTTLYKESSVINEVVLHSRSVPLSSYINDLNKIIDNLT